jgi:hypothetical protein
MTVTYEANEWACPDNPRQLWLNLTLSTTLLMTLTLFPLILLPGLSKLSLPNVDLSVYRAWALPHLENALHHPTDQMTHNRFSFFWPQHNHPEYPYTNKTPDILLDINPGESSPECTTNEMSTQSITCNSLTPPPHSHNEVNAAIEDTCNVIRYDLTAIKMEIKNLIDHNTFILGETPCKDELIISVKLV